MKKEGVKGFDRAEAVHVYDKIKDHTDLDPITQQSRTKRIRDNRKIFTPQAQDLYGY